MLVYVARQADDHPVDRSARHIAFAAALLCGCSAAKHPSPAQPVVTVPPGPANASVPTPGGIEPIPLDDRQRAELQRTVAAVPPESRGRLRYALALGEDGKRHLVIYDGQGLGAGGRGPRKTHDYVVFRVLNANDGEHYDPQQNVIVAPLASAPQAENGVLR